MDTEKHIKVSLLCVMLFAIIVIMFGFVLPYCISQKNTLFVVGGFIALGYSLWLVVHVSVAIHKIVKSKGESDESH